MTEDEKDNWERLRYRMDEEGFHYCFNGYSSWEEIEDEEFHRLKEQYLKSAEDLREYVENKLR